MLNEGKKRLCYVAFRMGSSVSVAFHYENLIFLYDVILWQQWWSDGVQWLPAG